MKPPSNVKTPAQYIASLPVDRAKTITTVRALVNKHIPRGYDECLVWGTIGWTIPLSRYPDTYNNGSADAGKEPFQVVLRRTGKSLGDGGMV
jgi:hypothetical protein